MDLGVRAQECAVSSLFAPGHALCMPPYQRSYSWGDTEARELLGDLLEAAENGTSHFIGAIVLVRPGNGEPQEIVDGQQRLTTLTILLCVLRDLEEDEEQAALIDSLIRDNDRPLLGEEPRWRLALNHIDGPFFRETIQQPGATLLTTDEPGESEGQRRMSGNAAAFLKELRNKPLKLRRRLVEVIRDRCALVRVSVSDRAQGYGVFRVLNTRGKAPNNHDIIKTELFEQAQLNVDEADRYAREWLEHEARLGGDALDDLLKQIRFLYDKSGKDSVIVGFRRAVTSKLNAREFLDKTLPRYVEAFHEITTGQIEIGEHTEFVRAKLNQLRTLEHRNWRAPAMKFLVERRNDTQAIVPFFKYLERLGFVIQLIIHDRNQRYKRYRRVIELAGSNKKIDGRSGPLAISRDEVRKSRDRLLGRFATFNQRRSMALRMNAALAGGSSLAPDADATVEHVLPRNIGEDSYWLTTWPDPHKRREQCDTLGNFVLLPRDVNQQADRQDYRAKKAVYFQDNVHTFALTQDLRDIEAWTSDIVRQRTEQLAKILIDEWEL